MPDLTLTIDNQPITVASGTTILQAARSMGALAASTQGTGALHANRNAPRVAASVPTICYHEHFTPPSLCRLCVVEVEKSRVLVQACSRLCENGMVVRTDSPRVLQARQTILELLDSAVDLSDAPEIQKYISIFHVDVKKYADGVRRESPLSSRIVTSKDSKASSKSNHPVTILDDNPFYLRDYSKCIMCWRCVQACGEDVQWTFAIAKAGRGFEARIATFFDVPIPDSTCVYCGNCVQACPTGALKSKREFWIENGKDLRELARVSNLDRKRKRSRDGSPDHSI